MDTFVYWPNVFVNYRQRPGSILKTKSYKNIHDLAVSNNIEQVKQIQSCFSHEDKVAYSAYGLLIGIWAMKDLLESDLEDEASSLATLIEDNMQAGLLVDRCTAERHLKAIHPGYYLAYWVFFKLGLGRSTRIAWLIKYRFIWRKTYRVYTALKALRRS